MIKNMRLFKIKYFGATNYKGSRIKIIDLRFKKSKFVARSYKHMDGTYDAIDYLTKIGIKIEFKGEATENETILATNNFEIMIDEVKR